MWRLTTGIAPELGSNLDLRKRNCKKSSRISKICVKTIWLETIANSGMNAKKCQIFHPTWILLYKKDWMEMDFLPPKAPKMHANRPIMGCDSNSLTTLWKPMSEIFTWNNKMMTIQRSHLFFWTAETRHKKDALYLWLYPCQCQHWFGEFPCGASAQGSFYVMAQQ